MVATRRERPPGVSTDDLYDILSDPWRRALLRQLRSRDGAVATASLAHEVAALEGSEPGDADSRTEYERIRIDLRHRHAPKMADAGIVDFDPEASTIELTADLPPIESLRPE